MYSFDEVKAVDSEVAAAIQAEMDRQNSHIELIASENWVMISSFEADKCGVVPSISRIVSSPPKNGRLLSSWFLS